MVDQQKIKETLNLKPEEILESLTTSHGTASRRYKLFSTGFLASILLTGVCGWFITPALGPMIVLAYIIYFCRVNLILAGEQRDNIKQAMFNLHARIKLVQDGEDKPKPFVSKDYL